MPRWTKKGAVRRMRENEKLQEILRIEPRLWPIINEAVAQRRNKTYQRVRMYIALRNRVVPLVGWYAEREELRTTEQYRLVIDTIVDLLPPDETDLWPEGRPGDNNDAR
jgi:hypothetical protein